jgi:UDP-N-acetylmuramoyl-L-alanyl-D-glutamate--2,6-diaminopimelate ligase
MVYLPTVYPVACHTKNVGKGTLFVAIKGLKDDGYHYIAKAIEQGSRTIVIEEDVLIESSLANLIARHTVDVIRVPQARRALAELSAKSWGYPAQKLNIIGITGTKGKSTTSFLVEHLLRTAGFKTALLSSVKNKITTHEFASPLTTPQPDYLHMFFAQCVEAGVEYVVMEVAAQAFSMDRVAGLSFIGGIFTNFSPTHGEFYPEVKDYFQAKKQLISHLAPHAPLVLNADDSQVRCLSEERESFLVGTSLMATVKIGLEAATLDYMIGSIQEDGTPYLLKSNLIGDFNNYNIGMAVTMGRALGLPWPILQAGVQSFTAVPGRLERYKGPNGARIFIDYANAPPAIEAVLSMLKAHSNHLVVVSGAGGDRDKTMRPRMGNALGKLADKVILTSDNPRSENPADIALAMQDGVALQDRHKVIIELDREKAIRQAYAVSTAESIIALLGKGPDEYQIILDKKIPFSERTIIRSLI